MNTNKIIATIIMSFLVLGLTLVIDYGVVKLLCWAFGIAFSWKIFIGALVIISILNSIAKRRK